MGEFYGGLSRGRQIYDKGGTAWEPTPNSLFFSASLSLSRSCLTRLSWFIASQRLLNCTKRWVVERSFIPELGDYAPPSKPVRPKARSGLMHMLGHKICQFSCLVHSNARRAVWQPAGIRSLFPLLQIVFGRGQVKTKLGWFAPWTEALKVGCRTLSLPVQTNCFLITKIQTDELVWSTSVALRCVKVF